MGEKRTGKRKHLFFYLTCIIIILETSILSGCAFKAKHMLMETQDLIILGNYKTALENSEQLLKEYPQTGDSALFQMGLIFAHPENPDRDYKKSLLYFTRLIKEFPDSNLKPQSQMWIALVYKVVERNKKNKELRAELIDLKENLKKENKAKKGKINELQKNNQLKDKKIDELQNDNQLKDKKIDELQQQIEKLKEIDLSIQQKKKKANLK